MHNDWLVCHVLRSTFHNIKMKTCVIPGFTLANTFCPLCLLQLHSFILIFAPQSRGVRVDSYISGMACIVPGYCEPSSNVQERINGRTQNISAAPSNEILLEGDEGASSNSTNVLAMNYENDDVEVVEANFNELFMPNDEVQYSTDEDFWDRILLKRCRVSDGGDF